ncbi:Mpo1-like protein [Paenactinomyces guangxiensis]|uniref:DUF962 domain-containing protein n=1 Tax=Paenactinomyces guangxiensis TaxID=1490290 RepID=A0A7W2A8C1_9BACL|nr:DUF962 domain-containing protein [Paenactinomyces guangxiensis]MBA4494495.1 DUF962 domain-containing protein [Paenactinomyces guangxiensis]MBH8591450.1 DUF962 domain-containing protein [Paenactinomyces guangxiensis]
MDFSRMLEKYRQDHQHPVNKLTHAIGIPLIIISLPWFFFNWKTALILFVLGWAFQFVGHWFEGKKPSFFSNPTFLIVGPVYFLRKLFNKHK